MCACPLLRLELSLQKFVEICNKSGKIRENRHKLLHQVPTYFSAPILTKTTRGLTGDFALSSLSSYRSWGLVYHCTLQCFTLAYIPITVGGQLYSTLLPSSLGSAGKQVAHDLSVPLVHTGSLTSGGAATWACHLGCPPRPFPAWLAWPARARGSTVKAITAWRVSRAVAQCIPDVLTPARFRWPVGACPCRRARCWPKGLTTLHTPPDHARHRSQGWSGVLPNLIFTAAEGPSLVLGPVLCCLPS